MVSTLKYSIPFLVNLFVVFGCTVDHTESRPFVNKKRAPEDIDVIYPRPVAKSDVVDVWIGMDDNGITYYRFELRADGRGSCVQTFLCEGAVVEEITSWELVGEGGNLRILLKPDPQKPSGIESIVGKLKCTWYGMTLDVRGKDWQHRVILWREDVLVERGKFAEKALQEKLTEKTPQ